MDQTSESDSDLLSTTSLRPQGESRLQPVPIRMPDAIPAKRPAQKLRPATAKPARSNPTRMSADHMGPCKPAQHLRPQTTKGRTPKDRSERSQRPLVSRAAPSRSSRDLYLTPKSRQELVEARTQDWSNSGQRLIATNGDNRPNRRRRDYLRSGSQSQTPTQGDASRTNRTQEVGGSSPPSSIPRLRRCLESRTRRRREMSNATGATRGARR